MQLKKIKSGKWYKTTHGVGVVTRVGGTHPPSVMVNITAPMPRGKVNLTARDILEEVEAPQNTPGTGE